MTDEDVVTPRPLPDGTRLLHIGPHKTGTTALQAALWQARASMLDQGVRHAGRFRNPVSAVRAVTGQLSSYSDRPPPMRDWRSLVGEISAAEEPRLVVSSEYFAHADDAAIRRIATDLDPARVRIAVTLRPLARIIPSMWQQNVQAGQRSSLDRFLHNLFPEPPAASTAGFWSLHRHDQLIARWADVVGADRVTAIVADDRDHARVLRVFEGLLGLRDGTFEFDHDLTNRSLTANEVEAVRAFNAAFRSAGLDRALHARVMRYGAAQHIKRRPPGAGEVGIRLPDWVLGEVDTVAREMVAAIAASGVQVVGDLSMLVPALSPSGTDRPGPAAAATTAAAGLATPVIAATMAMGILATAGEIRNGVEVTAGAGAGAGTIGSPDRVPSYLVAGTLVTRAQATTAIGLNRISRRVTRRSASGARGDDGRRIGTAGRYGSGIPKTSDQRRMDAAIPDDATPLPEGARVVHIGPPKTGTTALQGAFHVARAAAEAQGVHYAGRNRHSISAVQAVLGKTGFYSVDTPPDLRLWRKLVDDVRGSSASRVVLSSEFFADAKPDAIRRVVDDLDASPRPGRRHAAAAGQDRALAVAAVRPEQRAAVVRRLARRDAQQGAGTDLAILLVSPPARPADRRAGRRSSGRDRITVVALDERDHDFVLRAFERLTGLRVGHARVAARRRQPLADDGRDRGRPRVQHRVPRGGAVAAPPQSRHELRRGALHEGQQVPPADAAARRDAAMGARPGRRGRARDRRRDRRLGRPRRRRPRVPGRGPRERP